MLRRSLSGLGWIGCIALSCILFGAAPVKAATEPSAENTDAGTLSIHFVHYDAQELSVSLNLEEDGLDFTDAVLTLQESDTEEPIQLSLLSSDGAYTLYQRETPAERISGSFSVTMITKPGYTLNLDQASWTVNGQSIANGGSVSINQSSASMGSFVSCRAAAILPDDPAEDPAEPEAPLPVPEATEPDAPAPKPSVTSPASGSAEVSPSSASSQNTPAAEGSSAPLSGAPLEAEPITPATAAGDSASPEKQILPVTANSPDASAEAAAQSRPTIGPVDDRAKTFSPAPKKHFSLSRLTRNANVVLGAMILTITVMILFVLISSLREDLRQKRYHPFS